MEIGPTQEPYIVEPAEDPFKRDVPTTEPAPLPAPTTPEPSKLPQPVPA